MEIDNNVPLPEFRLQVRDWIARHASPELSEMADWRRLLAADWWAYPREMATEAYREWDAAMTQERLVCGHWPARYGGRDLTVNQSIIVDQECLRANVPRVFRDQGEAWVGPSILDHGTEAQKDYYLPRIVSGEDSYCQGFSEPNFGSDLAALETRGRVVGDELIVTGQKIWTTYGLSANKIFILCRTDPDKSLRHRGLTYVIADIAEAGSALTFRPIRQLNGEDDFCETFIDDLHVSLDNVIGGIGNGWKVAMTTLDNERGGRLRAARNSVYELDFHDVLELAADLGPQGAADVKRELLDLYGELEALQYWAEAEDWAPHGSVEKVISSEWLQRLGALALTVLGEKSLVRPEGVGESWEGGDYRLSRWQRAFFSSLAVTIASGTTEIQKNVIAERALGMPREAKV